MIVTDRLFLFLKSLYKTFFLVYKYIESYLLTQSLCIRKIWLEINFYRSPICLNLELYVPKTCCYTSVKELSLPYVFPVAEEKTVWFIHFLRLLVIC